MTEPALSGPARAFAPVPRPAGDCLRRILTAPQTAIYTGIPVSTLGKRRIYGGGPAVLKIGRSVRYQIEPQAQG